MKEIENMSYVEFMSFLGETNRPPGGKRALKRLLDYCDVGKHDKILDVGCNTGFCSFEAARQKKMQGCRDRCQFFNDIQSQETS